MRKIAPVLFSFFLPCILFAKDIVVDKDITVNNTWTLANDDVLTVTSTGHIHGTGTIKFQGMIIAGPYQHIFDQTLTLQLQYISICWLGAGSAVKDNAPIIEKACNSAFDIFVPPGTYNIKSIRLYNMRGDNYIGKSINLYGKSNYWTDRSILVYTEPQGFALGLQIGKGTTIEGLTIRGPFKAPKKTGTGPEYYKTSLEDYGDSGTSGLVVDYDGSKSRSGSSACNFRDLYISGFTVCYNISPNGRTQNADILQFKDIRVGECRIGFQTGQSQEKGNRVQNLVCWSNCHTLIYIARKWAGNWTFDGGNAAGGVINFCYIWQSGWFSSHITNFYAENLWAVGYIGTGVSGDEGTDPGFTMDNCTLHFITGFQRRLLNTRGDVFFSRCNFQYYGKKDEMWFGGSGIFDKCVFSGKRVAK